MDVPKRYEITPLLSGKTVLQKHKDIQNHVEDIESETSLEHLFPRNMQKERVSLCFFDFVLITMQYLQVFALMQSMAMRWVWPENWISNMYFLFIVNMDIWEIFKIKSESSALNVQSAYISSSDIMEDYLTIELAWLFIVLLYIIIFIVIIIILHYRYPHKTLRYIAVLRRVSIVILEIFTFPIGIVIFRLFQCTPTSHVYVDNEMICFQGDHLFHVFPGLILAFALFIVYPAYLFYSAWKGRLGSTNKHHEVNMLLKETEFLLKLNNTWLTQNMFIYSSFRLIGIYHRVIMHIMKLLLLIIFSAAFNSIFAQAASTLVILSVFLLLFLIVRPYRVTSFNVMLIFSQLCLVGNSVLGTMITASTPIDVLSSWMLPQYSIWLLVAINVIWLTATVTFSLYLLTYTVCHILKKISDTIWPTLKTSSPESQKYLAAILKGKMVLVKLQSMPPMFATVHELVHQIKVINAYVREAEFLDDNLHCILLDLLDELIEMHSNLSPQSLFADSIKESIQETAAEFMTLMPSFSQRLAQRDYDFILIPPQKKQMLLKMYILGLFLNGRRQKTAKHQLTDQALVGVWQEPELGIEKEEDGYFEDLYPEPLEESFNLSSDEGSAISSGWVDLTADLPGLVVMEADLLSSASPFNGTKKGEVNLTFIPSEGQENSSSDADRYGPGSGTADDETNQDGTSVHPIHILPGAKLTTGRKSKKKKHQKKHVTGEDQESDSQEATKDQAPVPKIRKKRNKGNQKKMGEQPDAGPDTESVV